MVLLEALSGRHLNMALFYKGAERGCIRLSMEEVRAGIDTFFWASGRTLTNSVEFKCLGCILVATKYDWTELM